MVLNKKLIQTHSLNKENKRENLETQILSTLFLSRYLICVDLNHSFVLSHTIKGIWTVETCQGSIENKPEPTTFVREDLKSDIKYLQITYQTGIVWTIRVKPMKSGYSKIETHLYHIRIRYRYTQMNYFNLKYIFYRILIRYSTDTHIYL